MKQKEPENMVNNLTMNLINKNDSDNFVSGL